MIKQPIISNINSSMQFFGFLLLAIVILIVTLIIGSFIAYGIWGNLVADYLFYGNYDLTNNESVNMLKYMQMLSQLGLMVIPSFVFAFLINRNVGEYLKLDNSPKRVSIILSIVLIFFSAPLISWMVEINENLDLPDSFSNLETWMRNYEDLGNTLSNSFLLNSSISGLIINILMMGVLAAVGEELVFRGIIQKIFTEWFKNVHIAVVVSAIFFSAFHFQFYGFFPRFMMGLLLGYLFVWTGSLWVPIVVHFVNNVSAVVISFLFSRGLIETNYEEFGNTQYSYQIILSGFIVIVLLVLIYKSEKNTFQKKRK